MDRYLQKNQYMIWGWFLNEPDFCINLYVETPIPWSYLSLRLYIPTGSFSTMIINCPFDVLNSPQFLSNTVDPKTDCITNNPEKITVL